MTTSTFTSTEAGAHVITAVYGGGEANAPFLVIYLTALSAVTYAIIRFKSWWRLSIVGLIGPAQHGALIDVAIGDDEVLAAGIPGTRPLLVFGRRRFVEFRIFGACKMGGGGFGAD